MLCKLEMCPTCMYIDATPPPNNDRWTKKMTFDPIFEIDHTFLGIIMCAKVCKLKCCNYIALSLLLLELPVTQTGLQTDGQGQIYIITPNKMLNFLYTIFYF